MQGFAILLIGFLSVQTGWEALAKSAVARPQYPSEFILKQLLQYKNLPYRADVPVPQVLFSSEALLNDFQNDIEPQWGFRPTDITNVFVFRLNKIYLYDDQKYYEDHGRCIDDSLAHEMTHYIQVKYRGWDLNDESLEWDAIDAQNWFRSQFCGK